MQEQDLTKDSKMKHERGNGIKGTDEAVIMMMGEKRSEGIILTFARHTGFLILKHIKSVSNLGPLQLFLLFYE